jgi:hypothetical protein
MRNRALILFTIFVILLSANACRIQNKIFISCSEDNDVYIMLKTNKIACVRYDTPEEVIKKAPANAGVMILADGYPSVPTPMDSSLYEIAQAKNLKLYVEYPSFLPGTEMGNPTGTFWERAVISSDAFAPGLEKYRIVAIHDCHYVPLKLDNPDIVVARVAGFDTAVFGLPEESYPVLGSIKYRGGDGVILVSATKLSQFVTGRYAPADAWQAIWKHILVWLQPGIRHSTLDWTPTVRPSFTAGEPLPGDAEEQALRRGIEWYFNSRMVMNEQMLTVYNRPTNDPVPASANPDPGSDWPFGHRVGYMPDLSLSPGDGSLGVLEGFDAKIFYDGTQPVRWWRRSDCNGEIAGAMAAAGQALQDQSISQTGSNIGDWLYFESMMSLGDRSDVHHPAYGLMGWNNTPEYCGPGTIDGYSVYYGDDNARNILGMILSGAVLNTDRYNERLAKLLLANLRVSGIHGFQPDRIDQAPLVRAGWEKYFFSENISYSPHYQANMWACYLWAWQHTGFELFLERAKTAIGMTMTSYPDGWKWTNGIQQERAKMLLPLAWLVRVDDNPEHRAWLNRIAGDLIAGQHASGAIREEIGEAGKGGFPPPASNEAYGTTETPLIQTNDDGVSDMLYTVGFAFLGLHEAAAATGDPAYREAGDKLAEFLCRIQIRSEKHPELDGGWFRAFDFNRWEYWASNGDAGWGAWCIESGWSQSWITAVLALRQMETTLWDITGESEIDKNFSIIRQQMLPDEILRRSEVKNK